MGGAVADVISYTPIGIAVDLVTGNDNPVVTTLAPFVAPVVTWTAPIVAPIVAAVAPIVAAVAPTPPPAEPCEGSWGDYGACSKTCGSGTQTSTWTTTKNPAHGGTACPNPTTYSQACNTQACPIDCVGSWGTLKDGSWAVNEWGACSQSCGGGTKTKTWTTTTPSDHGGTACPSPTTKSESCNTQACPINCEGSWADYGECSKTCGGGTIFERWTTTTPSAHGGTACPSPKTKSESCNEQACTTSTGPSTGPSTDGGTDEDIILYASSGFISLVGCCILVLIIILSMSGKPPPRGRFRR